MKQMSMLFTAAIFLGGAHSLYAQISPEMSASELKALIEARGANLDPLPTTGAEDMSKVDLASDQEVAEPLPPYVTVDNNPPYVYQTGACTLPDSTAFTVTGESMGTNMSFQVTVDGKTPSGAFSETVPWLPFLPLGDEDGAAIGHGWMLYQKGDTWDKLWSITTDPGVVISSITIEAWNNSASSNRHAVFDIIDGIKTPPSKGGFPFTKKPPLNKWPSDTAAVYSLPVLPAGIKDVPPDHDLYGTLEITFPTGFTGTASTEGLLMFRADTDCMPVTQIRAYHRNKGFNITLSGEGLIFAHETCGGNTQNYPPYDVPRDNLRVYVPYTSLTPGCCYSFTDENSNGISLEVDDEEMPNNEYCH